MRFAPTYCLREGMINADNLYGESGELVLAKNTMLTMDYIKGIRNLNYHGIYIEDDILNDIPIVNTINERVRNKTVRSLKDIFISKENDSPVSKKKFNEIENQVETIVEEILENKNMMVNMVDLKVFDDYTYFHSVNVAVLSIVLGTALGLDKTELCNLGFGALLHDIGKVFITKEILNKEGPLTDEEFTQMKKHSSFGYEYLIKEYECSKSSQLGIRDHHEKFAGGGYPNNIKGDDISLYGRIISIADVYDALTSDRPYRKGLIPSEAIEYIMGSNCVLFDPDLVRVFITKIAPYPVGSCVKLSNGLIGIVTENFESYCLRPNVWVFRNGDVEVTPYEICLADHEVLNITVIGFA
ncbi:HD-GYP domain-containing protein [Acetobacterium bakii]|uniref:Phosphohydrolase n=1 Tax=Acetobacterium bakii TaxID=52689 RepID=A0A0L6TZ13_9FIRM|nr:HD-GYP domain-containing protein [Acetobacterium bakii]KNZ41504.1 phosphohydrolase [Acetobacterium bakii]